ncbi:MAG: di-heme oxidoredictase family protein [Segetibacter sp.]
MKKIKVILVIVLSIGLLVACEKILTRLPEDDSILDGPLEGLNSQEKGQFLRGDVAFNDEIFTPENGLGPVFVGTSCGSCHKGDGKGHPFSTLTRFGQADTTISNQLMTLGGPQLQNRAIPGVFPEQLPPGIPFSRFTPPANTGLGLLGALTDAQILSNSDPNDIDGDGISGRPNYIIPPSFFQPQPFHIDRNGKYIGRFGKKAVAIDLLQQTVNAYLQDIGITSDFEMNEPLVYNGTNPQPDNVPDPEISRSTVNNVVFYLRTLKEPIQRNINNPDVLAGKKLFSNIACGKCHTPEFTTPQSDIGALSNKKFFPYSDLLLHDMGPGLDDGFTEGIAKTSEWRTPPLWGIGLSKNSQGGQLFLLHDGRAKSMNEAILLHGGEAKQSRSAYSQLNDIDKKNIIKFLESL